MFSCCRKTKQLEIELKEKCFALDNDTKIVLVIDDYYILSTLIQSDIIKYDQIYDENAEYFNTFWYIHGEKLINQRMEFNMVKMRQPNFIASILKNNIQDAKRRNINNITVEDIVRLINYMLTIPSVKELMDEVVKYKSEIVRTWTNHKKFIKETFYDICRIPFPDNVTFYYYLTLPSVNIAHFFGNNVISFGINNREMIVPLIIHELLHSIFPPGDTSHAIIEMVADFTLCERFRAHLATSTTTSPNGSADTDSSCADESPTTGGVGPGHRHLDWTRNFIKPYWDEYMRRRDKNIYNFLEDMRNLLG